jgi:DNA repair protein RecO (recombination protein O)
MNLSSEGVVLRDFSRDEDRILTILTRGYGVITAFANKANRPRSSLVASTELLCHSGFELFQNRERTVVDKADPHHSFFGLRSRVEDLALGCWFAQLMQELGPQNDRADDYIDLLLSALYLLEGKKRPLSLLKAAYELRLLTLAGYMPDLVACADCGEYVPGGMSFSLQGHLACPGHTQPGLYPVGDGVLAAMRHAIYAAPKKVFSFSLSGGGLGALSRISEAYMLYQVEKTFPALEFYRSVV